MGTIGYFASLPDDQLRALVQAPNSVRDFLEHDLAHARVLRRLDVDKAWHAIHFTLNGHAWEGEEPLFLAVLGGEEFDEEFGEEYDEEFGEYDGADPARYLWPEQVKEVATALRSISPQDFAARYDPAALAAANIYPPIWNRADDGLWYVQHHYKALRTFYLEAAERGAAVILYLVS